MEHAQPKDNSPIYFWRPHEDHGYLGQWFPSPFTASSPIDPHETITFPDCETYMMYHKAILFSDIEIAEQILLAKDPKQVKALGRQVRDFDDKVWKMERVGIVMEGNRLKFAQNETLRGMLLLTRGRELVEASPMDRVWGIGFGRRNAEKRRERWGMNLLGKALMMIRDEFLSSSSSSS
jgi:ribA/ribD-fused uncharacterized protein